jgi:hypothetical protein
MKNKAQSENKPNLGNILENATDKRNAWKKIIQELDKEENNKKQSQTKNKKS